MNDATNCIASIGEGHGSTVMGFARYMSSNRRRSEHSICIFGAYRSTTASESIVRALFSGLGVFGVGSWVPPAAKGC